MRVEFFQHLRPAPFDLPNYGALTADQAEFMKGETERMIGIGAWEETTDTSYVSPAFLVPKKDGGWRMVVDLRHLNQFCKKRTTRYEGLKTLKRLARQDDYMVSWDVGDGFYHIAIAEEDRQYFTFRLGGRLLRLAALPMGWINSPFYFTKVMRALVAYLRAPALATRTARRAAPPRGGSGKPSRSARRQRNRVEPVLDGPFEKRTVGLRLLPFVDDFLALLPTEKEAYRARDFVEATLNRLGLTRKPGKGAWEHPVQRLEHLGMVVDTKKGVFQITPAKLNKLRITAKDVLCRAARQRRLINKKALAKFCGQANAVSLAVPEARFRLRELYWCMSSEAGWGKLANVRLTAQAWRDLEWWQSLAKQKDIARCIWRSPDTATLHCDASKEPGVGAAWGAMLNHNPTKTARGFFSEEDLQHHITHLELVAVRHAIETFLPELRGRRVKLFEDNQAVMHILNNLSSRSPALMDEMRRLYFLMDTNEISLRAEYIRSAKNVVADALSRVAPSRDDRSLLPEVFEDLEQRWGPHTVDRFAAAINTHCRRYNSRWRDPGSEAVDAMAQDWTGEHNFVHPPWEELPDVVEKLRCSGAMATVIAPLWPAAAWCRELLAITSEYVELGPGDFRDVPGWCAPHAGTDARAVACRVPGRPPDV